MAQQITPEKIFEFDLRQACLHEAGHVAVARHLGDSRAMFIVFRNRNVSPDWKTIGGKCFLNKKFTRRQYRLIGLAGAVTTYIHGQGDPDWADALDFLDLMEMGETDISPTDLKMADGYRRTDVVACIDLVRQLWPAINELAQQEYDRMLEALNEHA